MMPRKDKKLKPINRHKLVRAVRKVREDRTERLEKMLNAAERMERKRRGQEPAKRPIRLNAVAPMTVQEFMDAAVNAPL